MIHYNDFSSIDSTHLASYMDHCATDEQPLDDEWARGAILVHPPFSYGTQLRQERSIRLVAFGGSNTAQTAGLVCTDGTHERLNVLDAGYVFFLDQFLKNNVSSDSYALNEGRSGRGARDFVGNSFAFEGFPLEQWPNVLLLEFAFNCQEKSDWTTARDFDALMRSLRRKWVDRDLEPPEFVIFELFTVEWLLKRAAADSVDRLAQVNNISLHLEWSPTGSIGFDRGLSGSLQISTFARFYAIPLLSWADVAFPSWLRHWVSAEYVNSTNQLWAPCVTDGTHLSLRGQELTATRLIGGFLLDQLQNHSETPRRSKDSHIYDFDLRLFAPDPEAITVARFTSWGLQQAHHSGDNGHNGHNGHNRSHSHNTVNTLAPTVLRPPTSSSFQFVHAPHRSHQLDAGHTCLGSWEAQATAHFRVPVTCNSTCQVLVSTLHSWNSSYVGNLACGLVSVRDNAVVANVTIQGVFDAAGTRMKQWTMPISTVVTDKAVPGDYTLECVKLDGLFTCIDTLAIVETRQPPLPAVPEPPVPGKSPKTGGSGEGGTWSRLRQRVWPH